MPNENQRPAKRKAPVRKGPALFLGVPAQIEVQAWEGQDYVVVVDGTPYGRTLRFDEARLVADWLATAPELRPPGSEPDMSRFEKAAPAEDEYAPGPAEDFNPRGGPQNVRD